jgi:hypothetical protein
VQVSRQAESPNFQAGHAGSIPVIRSTFRSWHCTLCGLVELPFAPAVPTLPAAPGPGPRSPGHLEGHLVEPGKVDAAKAANAA